VPENIKNQQVVCPHGEKTENITFLARQDGSVNFTRNFSDYISGFGSAQGEFWLGLRCLYAITITRNYTLQVDFSDFDGRFYQSRYSRFSLGHDYRLRVGGYDKMSSGGDSLKSNNNTEFSTYDCTQTMFHVKCPALYKGGWWYSACGVSNPTGLYLKGGQVHRTGTNWFTAKNNWYSYKTMMFTLIPA